LDDSFEGNELDDGVWNLSSPKWSDSLEESVGSLFSFDEVEALNSTSGEGSWLGGLHSDLQL
jgi:hypothetical protein